MLPFSQPCGFIFPNGPLFCLSLSPAKMTAAALFQKVAVLLGFCWPAVHATPCGLSIHPVNPVVPFGGSVTLNCSRSCANATKLNWEASSRGDTQEAEGWTAASFVNITNWDFQPVCYEDSGKEVTRMLVYLYQFSSPEIHLAPDIVAERWHTIVCDVPSLKVGSRTPHNISMSLSSGGQLLNVSQGSSPVEYTSVAQVDQDGAEILCLARLEVGAEVLRKTANSNLTVYARPHNVTVTPSVTTYKAGSDITVTCRAEGHPFPKYTWQLPFKDNVEWSDSNRTVAIRAAQSSNNGTYRCHVQNAYGSSSADVDVVYEGTSRNWVTTVVVVVGVLVLVVAIFICYRCRK